MAQQGKPEGRQAYEEPVTIPSEKEVKRYRAVGAAALSMAAPAYGDCGVYIGRI